MHFSVQHATFFILGIVAIICSRTMFALFDDPEGPNLLVVMVMAGVIYAVALVVYMYAPSVLGRFFHGYVVAALHTRYTKIILTIFVQMALTTVFYFCLR